MRSGCREADIRGASQMAIHSLMFVGTAASSQPCHSLNRNVDQCRYVDAGGNADRCVDIDILLGYADRSHERVPRHIVEAIQSLGLSPPSANRKNTDRSPTRKLNGGSIPKIRMNRTGISCTRNEYPTFGVRNRRVRNFVFVVFDDLTQATPEGLL